MKPVAILAFLLPSLFCAVAGAVRDGSTPTKAIVIRSTKAYEDEAFRFIRQRYPDAAREPVGFGVSYNGRTYILTLTFSTAHHGQHSMYFDITDYIEHHGSNQPLQPTGGLVKSTIDFMKEFGEFVAHAPAAGG